MNARIGLTSLLVGSLIAYILALVAAAGLSPIWAIPPAVVAVLVAVAVIEYLAGRFKSKDDDEIRW